MNKVLPLFFILFSLFFSNCMFDSPAKGQLQVEPGYGKVSIGFAGGEGRTVFPGNVFTDYEYTFVAMNGDIEGDSYPMTPDEDGLFTLKLGDWKVQVDALIGDDVAASGEERFTLDADVPVQDIEVILYATEDAGEGTFSYYITFPDGADITISLKRLPELTVAIDLEPTLTAAAISGTNITAPAGFYLLNIQLEKNGKYAGREEVIHIYDVMPSVYGTAAVPETFTDASFSAYTVTFHASDGSEVTPQTVPHGGKVTPVTTTNNAGFVFDGWYTTEDFDGDPWDFADGIVIHDLDLYAKWDWVPFDYIITGNGSVFTATRGSMQVGTTDNMLIVINAIKADAAGEDCTIQFGSGGDDVLNNFWDVILTDVYGGPWGLITLLGKINMQSEIVIAGTVSVDSKADIVTPMNMIMINNSSTGTVTISGGTVRALNSRAIKTTTKIIISGDAVIESASAASDMGTIRIETANGALEMTGGTVRNTAAGGNAIRNDNTGTVTISGGMVEATPSGYAVQLTSGTLNAALVLSGDPVISGRIRTAPGMLSVTEDFAPEAGRIYELDFASYALDMIAVAGGGTPNRSAHFRLLNVPNPEWGLVRNGNDLEIAIPPYIITGGDTIFSVTRGGIPVTNATNISLSRVIPAIGTAANGANFTMQFGDNDEVLDIGTELISIYAHSWSTITLLGSITSSNILYGGGTISVDLDVSIESWADIANTSTDSNGRAIVKAGSGTVTIHGGTVSAMGSRTIQNNSSGAIIINGGTVQATANNYAVYNNASGTITINGGTVQGSYGVWNAAAGSVTINGGIVSATTRAVWSNTGAVTINGGTVQATAANGHGVWNQGTGTVTINAGTVSAVTEGRAVHNQAAGVVTIYSPPAVILPEGEGTTGTIVWVPSR